MEDGAGIYRTGDSLARGARTSCASCRSAIGDVAIDDHSRTFNTELIAALELAYMLDVAEAIVASRAARARSRAARTSAPTSRRATTSSFLAHSLVYRDAGRLAAVEYLPVTITRWPPGRAGVREVARMAGHAITLRGRRATVPEQDSATPTFQDYEVPLREGLGRSSTR